MDEALKRRLFHELHRFRRSGAALHPDREAHMGEFLLLQALKGHHAETHGSTYVSDLHTRLPMSKPAVSQLLGGLEERGLIHREIDTGDRRKIAVTLTPEGKALMRRMQERMDGQFGLVLERFGEEDTRQLITLLSRLGDIIDEICHER